MTNNNNKQQQQQHKHKQPSVKVVVRLSHPATMELVLRKRLCFSVVKRHSLAEKLKRKLGQVTDHDHDGRDNESDDDDDDDEFSYG